MKIWSAEIKELEKLHDSFKGQHPKLDKEIVKLAKTDDENIVLVYARRCLEVIITDLCERELERDRGTEPLKGIIDKLHREKKVPHNIVVSMQNLNSLSTFGAHPKDFDPMQVKPVLLDLTTTLKWYLKYLKTQATTETQPGLPEEKRIEPIGVKKGTASSKKWILLASAVVLVCVVIVVALLAYNIFRAGNRVKIDESLAKSIAVLPFQNFSEDSDQNFMCLGLTDEIINHLFKLESFDKVASLTSVLTYQEGEKLSTEIGEELGVSYILEGTYKKIGEVLRVSAQLIEANSDRHIWQQDYNRPYSQIMSLQSEIALQITNQINAFITDEEKERIQKIPTSNLTAYEFYRRGIEIYNLHIDFTKAIQFFEKAIESDSTFALAFTYMAQCYQFIARYSFSSLELYEEAYSKAREAALKANELDPNLGEALAVYGLILAEDWEIYAAEEFFKRAIELSPGSPEVYSSYAQYLRWLGRYDESIELGKKIIDLDPTNPMNYMWLSNYYIHSGQYEKSIRYIEEASEFNIGRNYLHLYLAINYAFMDDYDKATVYVDSVMSNISLPGEFIYLGSIGWVYARAGYKVKAQQQIEYLLELSHEQFVDPIVLAFAYTGLGEYENAFSCISKAYELHTGQMIYLRAYADFYLKDISSDPRYDEILEKMGFELRRKSKLEN